MIWYFCYLLLFLFSSGQFSEIVDTITQFTARQNAFATHRKLLRQLFARLDANYNLIFYISIFRHFIACPLHWRLSRPKISRSDKRYQIALRCNNNNNRTDPQKYSPEPTHSIRRYVCTSCSTLHVHSYEIERSTYLCSTTLSMRMNVVQYKRNNVSR